MPASAYAQKFSSVGAGTVSAAGDRLGLQRNRRRRVCIRYGIPVGQSRRRCGNSPRRCAPIAAEPPSATPGRHGSNQVSPRVTSDVHGRVGQVHAACAQCRARATPIPGARARGGTFQSKAGFPASSSTGLSGFTVVFHRRSNCVVRLSCHRCWRESSRRTTRTLA